MSDKYYLKTWIPRIKNEFIEKSNLVYVRYQIEFYLSF